MHGGCTILLFIDFYLNRLRIDFQSLTDSLKYAIIYLIFNVWFTKQYYAIYVILKWDDYKSFGVAFGVTCLVVVSWALLLLLQKMMKPKPQPEKIAKNE